MITLYVGKIMTLTEVNLSLLMTLTVREANVQDINITKHFMLICIYALLLCVFGLRCSKIFQSDANSILYSCITRPVFQQ